MAKVIHFKNSLIIYFSGIHCRKIGVYKKHKVEKKITQNPSTQDMDDIFSLHPSMLILA